MIQTSPDSIPLRGASHCWETTVSDHIVATPEDTDIQPLHINDRSPIGLSICAAADIGRELEDGPFGSRHLVDGLLNELKHRAENFGGRKAPWLRWSLPHSLLDSADIMELMYFIGKAFQLGDSDDCFYCVDFSSDELTPQRAALFKGLGYNALALTLDMNDDTESLQQSLTSAYALGRDYHFQSIGLNLLGCDSSLIDALKSEKIQNVRLPDIINLSRCRFVEHESFEDTFHGLRNLGYRVLGNDCFVTPGSPLAKAQMEHRVKLCAQGYNSQNVTDIIGLGPGNLSALNHIRYHNAQKLADYLAQPRGMRFVAANPDARVKLVMDHLLCYHQLDIPYFEARYGMDLEKVLTTAWGPLGSSNLFQWNKKQLHLTALGVSRLTPLCRQLISCFC